METICMECRLWHRLEWLVFRRRMVRCRQCQRALRGARRDNWVNYHYYLYVHANHDGNMFNCDQDPDGWPMSSILRRDSSDENQGYVEGSFISPREVRRRFAIEKRHDDHVRLNEYALMRRER